MWKGRFDECKAKLTAFWDGEVMPREPEFFAAVAAQREKYPAALGLNSGRWHHPALIDELAAKARAEGLWNLFLPSVSGLTQWEYAQCAEIMGQATWFGPQIFNCDAPDTGNMETLHLYANAAQKEQWLKPLLEAKIRSAFCMTEPGVASSDATNIATSMRREGNEYVINGRKWWASGFGDSRCELLLVLVKTGSPSDPPHRQHSVVIVPRSTPGVVPIRAMQVFGNDDSPHGHWEVDFKDARVPVTNLLQKEGDGFAMAQGRLGPGRIHHCMRSIGMAERALSLMVARSMRRTVFGKEIARHGMAQEAIAQSRIEIDQARLLVLHCAKQIDTVGTRRCRQTIAMIKVVAPNMACKVIDRAMQVHGAMGVSQDVPLALMYAGQRTLRIADGPDEVHLQTVAKLELKAAMTKSAKL